jgi:hypothetical protein
MNNSEKNILILLGVGVAGFFGYRYYQKNKDKKNEVKTDENQNNSNTTTGYPGPTTGPTEYEKKVMKLQATVGAGVDGNPGSTSNSNTNRSVAAFYPVSYAKLGNVSPINIDAYLALNGVRQANVSGRIDQIWNAMGGGTPATLRIDSNVSAYYYDSSRGQYLATGGIFLVKSGLKIYKSTSIKSTLGFIVTVPVYSTSTKQSVGNRMVLIKPDNLYV